MRPDYTYIAPWTWREAYMSSHCRSVSFTRIVEHGSMIGMMAVDKKNARDKHLMKCSANGLLGPGFWMTRASKSVTTIHVADGSQICDLQQFMAIPDINTLLLTAIPRIVTFVPRIVTGVTSTWQSYDCYHGGQIAVESFSHRSFSRSIAVGLPVVPVLLQLSHWLSQGNLEQKNNLWWALYHTPAHNRTKKPYSLIFVD